MKLLVLGGGFTGTAVARRALDRGIPVIATTRSDARAAALRALGATALVSPRLDAQTLTGHIDAETRVLVAMPPDALVEASLAAALAHARVGAIAYVSSTAVYGGVAGKVDEGTPVDGEAPRASPRLEAEATWRRAGATIVRSPAIYGPGRGLHLRLARGEVRATGGPANAISRVHVDDLAAALFALLASGARDALYVMADLEPAPHAEVVTWICNALSVEPPPHLPHETLDETLRHDRRADSRRLRERLGLTLAYPTYREGYAQCIARDRAALDAAISERRAAAPLALAARAPGAIVTTPGRRAHPFTMESQRMPVAIHSLLAEWSGHFGGVPPFDQVHVLDFKPALEAAMADALAAIQRVADDQSPPTFDNTLAAMERAGRPLDRVSTLYNVWSATMKTAAFQAVEKEMEPKLAAYEDQITQNAKLFQRIEAVYDAPERTSLTPEQQRLTWLRWNEFVRDGAKLDAAAKARVAWINQRLATLFAQFSQNLLGDEEGHTLFLTSEGELAGLPASVRDAAAAAAAQQGHDGRWAITNTRSSIDPFLTYSERRDLREKVWRTYYGRGDNRDAHDNGPVVTEILQLRSERAKRLGYPSHAHWRVENAMAKTPDEAMRLMMQVWPAAIARVRQEVAEMQALADEEHAQLTIAPWDYRHYAEKVRKAKYDLDMNEVRPYLQLDQLRDGMFWVAGQLYGLSFAPVSGIPVYHPDVTVYEVRDAQGQHVGLWYLDPYARAGKSSGAWMSSYRRQERFDGRVTALVSNNANFVKPKPGEAVLVSWDDATTLFHEFGHALHALHSSVGYPSLSGTAVPRDYVEFPSQLNENWLFTPEVLSRFAVDAKGRPIPRPLVAKLERSRAFNQGFAVTEYLAGALIDMKLHLAEPAPTDPGAFERDELAKLGMPSEVVMRHRTPQFAHIFSGNAYSAGYYSYLWSEVLDHDAYEAFLDAGGPYDKAVAKRLLDTVLSVGNTVDPAEGYRAFRGRGPEVSAYLRSKGFPSDASAPNAPPRQREPA